MITNEIIKLQYEIYSLLAERRLKDAFGKLAILVEEQQDWLSRDKLNEMETSYRYMIQYMLDGVEDPERKSIYDHLVVSAYELTDRISDRLAAKVSPAQYYGWKRYAETGRKEIPLKVQLDLCDNAINDLSLASLLSEQEQDPSKVQSLKRSVEEAAGTLFMDIWTNYPAGEEDYAVLREALLSRRFPEPFVALMLSALLLNVLHRFDEQKLLILLDGYRQTSPEIQMRSLCCALIVMYVYRERLPLLKNLRGRIDALGEEPAFKTDLRNIFLQFIKSRETEKITRKMNEELLPEMMKLAPSLYKKIRQDDLMNDINALEENPEWQEMLDRNGIADKLKELTDLQMEGADVFMSTFAHLKNFPFFQSIQNWFLPFNPEHSSLSGVLDSKGGDVFKKMIGASALLCNSDKYSFCLSLTQMPESQREMMMGQFGAENAALRELENSELLKKEHSRENISNRYIQDLYRFFKLYIRRTEFTDPFAKHINLYKVAELDALLSDSDSLRLVGEYYFRRGYYDEALELFERLSSVYHSDHEIYQKIGFCYQKKGDYANALEAFLKAEIISPDNFWTIRRIATCYRNLKKPEMALSYYHRAEKLDPENLSVQMNIGHCYVEQKDYEEALKYYFKVDYLDPEGGKAWQPIAWCSFLVGKKEQSLRYYEKILNRKPVALDYLNAGHVEFSLGHIRQAIEYYRRCIELDNGDSSKFLAEFKQDMPDLIASGILPSDVPILLDQLMYGITDAR
ncbi:MAG TPA: tetratricopeptide repeat protein [Candidatus Barnesiella excrementigallinarum]|nr:tetratricopeptide repeat protein [Candidatus Barnesiella excrementigallinarum]